MTCGIGAALLAAMCGGSAVDNGDFEAPPAPDGAIPGWVLAVGARNGADAPLSKVEVDTRVGHGGRASLHLQGDDHVRAWRAARQEVAARPGATYTLTAFAKSAKIRGETVAGTEIRQFQNAYVALFLSDDSGRVVAKQIAKPSAGTTEWEKLTFDLVAPATTRKAEIHVFLSMSGDLWVDDVALDIAGGNELPPPVVLLSEDFETCTEVPREWVSSIGASNGTGGKHSSIAIDPAGGSPESPRTLCFSGDAATTQWSSLGRTFDVEPGDALWLSALVKAQDVRQEGVQFPNFHLWLAFQDADGKRLGAPQIAAAGPGTYAWRRTEARGVAPAGAARVEIGAFLSMSGRAFVDRIELVKRPGSTPAYADWTSLESQRFRVRFPKTHPRAARMADYGARLDAALAVVCRRLEVAYDERITAWIYADGEEGRRLTGRPLAFAAPEERAFHQTMENTIAHEMTHVVALKWGYAQHALFGEGLAVWLDGETDAVHHSRAAQLFKTGKLPALGDLLDAFRTDESRTYPAAGSFCGHAIATFGLAAFRRVYVAADPRQAALDAWKQSLEDVDRGWRAFLARQP